LPSFNLSLRARNSFGVSNFTKELLILNDNRPEAVNQVEIIYLEANVLILWNSSFMSYGFEF